MSLHAPTTHRAAVSGPEAGAGLAPRRRGAARRVGFDRRALTIDGERHLLLAGAIHYPRSTPDLWPRLMRRSKELGLNAIETYTFWNLHERERGELDFSGRLDLLRFLGEAERAGLDVVLRVGPYVCAETNYGGFPAWLRDLPGARLRTWSPVVQAEIERWLRDLRERLRGWMAGDGGPIVAVQLENEYDNVRGVHGEEGTRHLEWLFGLGRELGFGVPLICCAGTSPDFAPRDDTVFTINAMYAHQKAPPVAAAYPDQPLLWTEHWTSWYDTWEQPRHLRAADDIAYALARFVAAGGTGNNYYMWHGGTNFGRDGMYLNCTSYDFDAPLDEFGRVTPKARRLAGLHRALAEHREVILGGEPVSLPTGAPGVVVARFGEGAGALTICCNDRDDGPAEADAGGGLKLSLPPRSASIVRGGEVLFATRTGDALAQPRLGVGPPVPLGRPVRWPEPLPSRRPQAGRGVVDADRPVEQLLITRDRDDRLWYATTIPADAGRGGEVVLDFGHAGDVLHVFVDGELQASTRLLVERTADREPQRFPLRLGPGEHRLEVLSSAIGLVKHEVMLGNRNLAEEAKGFSEPPLLGGRPLPGPWRMHPGLVGAAGAGSGAGRVLTGAADPLSWLRWEFDVERPGVPHVVELRGLSNGFIDLNGHGVGRYWLLHDTRDWKNRPGAAVQLERSGEPTQTRYHLPAAWLKPEGNALTLFEERGGETPELCLRSAGEGDGG